MNNNTKIKVSTHAINRYVERINPNVSSITDVKKQHRVVKSIIRTIFSSSAYRCDNDKGIVFRNDELMLEFIVKNGVIKTLYPLIKRRKNNDRNKLN